MVLFEAELLLLLIVQIGVCTICNADKVLVEKKDLTRRENSVPVATNVLCQGAAASSSQLKI